jgi:DNA-binding LytR/AlgR family response regulator
MLYSTHLRLPSFWVLQFIGWCCFGLASLLFVMPYVRRPWELGYSNPETLLADQLVICFGFFLASLALRPVCRSLLRHPLPWFTLQFRALGWSVLVGTTAALILSHLVIATPDRIEVLEACIKASTLLFLWSNLYFSVKHSQQLSLSQPPPQSGTALQSEARTPASSASNEGIPFGFIANDYATRFSVRTGSRVQIISANDVEWIAAAGDYSELHTRTGNHLLRETMKSLEKRLDPTHFVRIHRSRIVCLPRIIELRYIENRECLVKLSDGSQHRCSRTYAARISSWLRNNR